MIVQRYIADYRTKLSLALGYLAQRRREDALIVDHSRSGSTWLRTMLVNVLLLDSKSNPDVFNKRIPVASIHHIRYIGTLSTSRIQTSHTSYLAGLLKVILVVRNGWDALVSYYHYVASRNSRLASRPAADKAIDLRTFFYRYYEGEYRHIWHKQVESWLMRGRQRMGERLLVVRCEEMQNDTCGILEQIVSFARLPVDAELIARAIRAAGLENMREVEKQRWKEKGLGVPDKASSFYRSGRSKNWEDYVTPELTERFALYSEKAIRLAGNRL